MHVLFFCMGWAGSNQMLAATVFDMNESCLKAQELIYELRFDEAEKILSSEEAQNPENIALPWLSESVLFLKLFISEDPALYKNCQKNWSRLISLAEKTHFNNAWYRHILSDMYIHRGLIRLKFNDQLSAGTDLQSAYKYLKENKKMFPYFLPDNKNHGLLSCVFSSVPSKYQWLVKLIGLQGDMKTGLAEIEAYLKSDLNYKEHICLKLEAAFIYAMAQHHLNKDSKAAWLVLEPYTRKYKSRILENYMRATVAGYNGMNDDMIGILQHKPSHPHAYSFYYMDFMLGLAKMRRLDSDADVYFRIFTVRYKGRNYLKSAYRNLAWLAQTRHDESAARTYYSLCAKNGIAVIEEDKQAEREASENLIWPKDLIRARLLFDGRYYGQAMKILNGISPKDLLHIRSRLELNYRKARILHEQEDFEAAIPFYKQTIELGRKEVYYFAAYSALQLGYIFEKQKKNDLAIQYFQQAKGNFPDNKEYAGSIEQKAKAGLKRLGK